MSEDEVRARLCAAMGYHEEDWLARACALLDGYRRQRLAEREYDVSTIGLRIRCARECAGMSQRQLALRLNVNAGRISDYERGNCDLPGDKIPALYQALRCVTTKGWLLMETDEGGPKVPTRVRTAQHDPRWYDWQKRRAAYAQAHAEAERKNAARKARLDAEGEQTAE